MITLSWLPQRLIPSTKGVARIASSVSAGTVRISCTSAPPGSQYRQQLDAGASRVTAFTGDVSKTWQFTPDASGVYVFDTEEFKAADFGGGYEGDDAVTDTTDLLASGTVSVEVGQRLTTTLGTGQNTSTLVLYAFGSTVYATDKSIHGETSPIIQPGQSVAAKAAAEDPTVVSELADLAGANYASILGDPEAALADLICKFCQHARGNYHYEADTVNTIPLSLYTPNSRAGTADSANALLKALSAHVSNDGGTGVGSLAFHKLAGQDTADMSSLPLVGPASQQSRLSQLLLIAELWRCFDQHSHAVQYHALVDSTDDPTNLTGILQIHQAYLASVAKLDQTAPANAHQAAVALSASGGFTQG